MSHTTLYCAFQDGDLQEFRRFQNSYGSCIFVWDSLLHYLPDYQSGAYPFELYPKLWAYEAAGGPMPAWERNVLRATYDRTAVRRKYLPVLAEHFRTFQARYHRQDRACSLADQACALLDAYQAGCLAVAWQQTSCADDQWVVRDPLDPDSSRMVNIWRDGGFHFLDMQP